MPNRKFFLKDFTERALQCRESFTMQRELYNAERALQCRDSQWRQDHNSGMVATVWMDRKPIYFPSNIHVAEDPYTFVVRHDQKGNDLIVTAPPCVLDYNENMGGIDLNDKMTGIDESRKLTDGHTDSIKKGFLRLFIMLSLLKIFLLHILCLANERGT